MKLFRVDYIDDGNEEVYLTLGEDNDTNETISKREQEKVEDKCSCYMGHWVFEINNIDGYDIKIEATKIVPKKNYDYLVGKIIHTKKGKQKIVKEVIAFEEDTFGQGNYAVITEDDDYLYECEIENITDLVFI